MALGVADDGRSAAISPHYRPLGHGLGSVVGPFAVNVRLQLNQESLDGRAAEHDDIIDAAQCGDKRRTIGSAKNRPPGPLQRGNGSIVVDGHNQPIALGGSRVKKAHVAHVQQIEAAVREYDGESGRAILRDGAHELLFGENLSQVLSGVPCAQAGAVRPLWNFYISLAAGPHPRRELTLSRM